MGAGHAKTVIAAVHPLTGGAAHFNAAMVKAMRRRGPVDVVSWRRLYPPLLYRGQSRDDVSQPPYRVEADFVLDWLDPRTWKRAAARIADVLVLPWLHPVMAPPYRYLLRKAPAACTRVVVCHNVLPHEPVHAGARLTRATLRHADLLVVHAPHQVDELRALGLADVRVLEAFHPRFEATDLAAPPAPPSRCGRGLALLAFGAVRPYKGIDLAVEALALVDPALDVRLIVAGRFWRGGAEQLRRRADELGLNGQVALRDGYVPNEEAARLFAEADATMLPYRSASQSGVAQLSFAYGRPVIATRVGGLPAAVADGRDGVLCEPNDPVALARAIERFGKERERLSDGVREQGEARSFRRYTELLDEAIEGLRR